MNIIANKYGFMGAHTRLVLKKIEKYIIKYLCSVLYCTCLHNEPMSCDRRLVPRWCATPYCITDLIKVSFIKKSVCITITSNLFEATPIGQEFHECRKESI